MFFSHRTLKLPSGKAASCIFFEATSSKPRAFVDVYGRAINLHLFNHALVNDKHGNLGNRMSLYAVTGPGRWALNDVPESYQCYCLCQTQGRRTSKLEQVCELILFKVTV